jgi:hypothetical protein
MPSGSGRARPDSVSVTLFGRPPSFVLHSSGHRDGKRIQVSSHQPKAKFQALAVIRGHIFTARGRSRSSGDRWGRASHCSRRDAYRTAASYLLTRLVRAKDQLLSLYDGQKVTPFPTGQKEKKRTTAAWVRATICSTFARAQMMAAPGRTNLLLHDPSALVPDYRRLCTLQPPLPAIGSRRVAAHKQA